MSKKITDKEILEALPGTGGIQLAVARKLGCARETVNRAISKSDRLKAAFAQEKESLVDLAESQLLKKIQNGDNTMIIFFLKTQGKARGYIERVEHDLIDVTKEDLKKMDKDARDKLKQKIRKRLK